MGPTKRDARISKALHALADAFHGLADAIVEDDAPRSASSGGALDWIDQFASPLGKRKHNTLCKQNVFPSAHKEGHRWLVRRAELDAYITTHGKPPKDKSSIAEIDRMLHELGMPGFEEAQ
jgi:hypothetical protein